VKSYAENFGNFSNRREQGSDQSIRLHPRVSLSSSLVSV